MPAHVYLYTEDIKTFKYKLFVKIAIHFNKKNKNKN